MLPNQWNDATVISIGPDWITATVKPSSKMQFMEAACRRWMDLRKAEGFTAKSLSWMGYMGEAIDGLSFGSRADGMLIRLSGDVALRHSTFVEGFADNISRLDLQVTVLDPGPYKHRAREAWRLSGLDGRVVSGITRTSLVESTPDGATCYIGSRASDRMYRVYDKAAESKGVYAKGTWRYEIEYKGDRALRVAKHLAAHKWSPHACLDVLRGAFSEYRIDIPPVVMGAHWHDTSPAHETDDQRRLAWLSDTIRPAVAKLLEGLPVDTVLEALGLEALLPPLLGVETLEGFVWESNPAPNSQT